MTPKLTFFSCYFQIVSQVPVTGLAPNVRWIGPRRAANSPTHALLLQA